MYGVWVARARKAARMRMGALVFKGRVRQIVASASHIGWKGSCNRTWMDVDGRLAARAGGLDGRACAVPSLYVATLMCAKRT